MLRSKDFDQHVDQHGLVDRLHQETINARVFGFAAHFLTAKGGDNDDGRYALERTVRPDPAGGFYSIEARHVPIQQDHIERAARIGALNCVDGFSTRCHLFYFGANGRQSVLQHLAG
jgi:hypothetical protein